MVVGVLMSLVTALRKIMLVHIHPDVAVASAGSGIGAAAFRGVR